jgi:hypothetical protein
MTVSGRVRHRWAVTLMVAGGIFLLLTFLAAFTIFGEIAAVVGVACLIAGAVILVDRVPPEAAPLKLADALLRADSRGPRNDLVSRQRFVALTQEVADGRTSHDP